MGGSPNSNSFEFNATDRKKWFTNLKLFLAPVATMYIVSVVATITANNNLFDWHYFIPTTMVQGAMVLYVLNTLLDLIKKYVNPLIALMIKNFLEEVK